MPPPPPPPPDSFLGSGLSAISVSVVRTSAPIEAAFCSAERVTLNGSTMPALTMSTRSPVIASYHDYVNQGEMNLLKGITPELSANEGQGILVLDDLTDTGKTAAEVRVMLPKAHFACVYAKPKGVPVIDTFVTEVSQDTWIYFPWDMGFTYQEPIAKGHAG